MARTPRLVCRCHNDIEVPAREEYSTRQTSKPNMYVKFALNTCILAADSKALLNLSCHHKPLIACVNMAFYFRANLESRCLPHSQMLRPRWLVEARDQASSDSSGQPHPPAPSIADRQQVMPSQGPVVFATEYQGISDPSQPGDAPHNAMVNSLLAQAGRDPLPAAENDETQLDPVLQAQVDAERRVRQRVE